MKSKLFSPFIWIAVLIIIVGLACNAVSGSPATEPPPPTQIPAPTQPPPPTDPPPQPTEPPPPTSTARPPKPTSDPAEPTESGGTQSALRLSDTAYLHPEGLFELNPIEGWTITQEDEGSVLFEAPDFSGAINIQVTNTGYKLDPVSFEKFVDARDFNFFIIYDNYLEIEQSVDAANGTAIVEKSLDFDGIPQRVISYYDQHDEAIFALDFWADEDLYDSYADTYDAFFDSITVDSGLAADQELYLWIYDFYGPGDLFTIEVPTSWRFETTSDDVSVVDTFYSPDEHAVIQNIAYDDGDEVTKSFAGAFALELLKTFYADDIRVTDDQVQEDGSERLIWNSPSRDYSGISFFESRGTTFLLFTVMYDNTFEDLYYDVLDYTVSTYDVP